ncbi:MAG TPA: heme o synthase [Candidatus Paceibacterota bacterium]|nr:heme o synthase [Candidatus Paceibacterota bacterium]
MIKAYYKLAKPGIVYGNALMFAAGFFVASSRGIDWPLFFSSLIGLSLIIGSACTFNNVADRSMDAKMPRTQKRAIPAGLISTRAALIFGSVLFLLGAATLFFFSSPLALAASAIGFFVYVFLYTPLKPKTKYALFVGAVAGAMPPVAGYAAVTNRFDWIAALLFALLFLWQLPHFVAIAFYRFEDYRLAGVPLFARAPKNDRERKIAKQIFAASLVVLLAGCLGTALWRLL